VQLYANIGIGHENDIDILKQRVVSAATGNADAVVLSKSTPTKVVPANKKYVPIVSKWGTMAYIDVAKRSELTPANAIEITRFCDDIGIPLIWSVTDDQAASWVREHCNATTLKLHYDAINPIDLIQYAKDNFEHVIYSHQYVHDVLRYYVKAKRNKFTIYYASKEFPPKIDELELGHIDHLQHTFPDITLAYESREAGIFPGIAVAYKGVTFIEKYLGDNDSDNPCILTPQQFYDFWNSMNIMYDANQIHIIPEDIPDK
jgi:sialic acid synthase SpsE|tara:strand:- start:25052 stop:25831 length:780 start_codon:yes stop_codon:yes gene_type:complete